MSRKPIADQVGAQPLVRSSAAFSHREMFWQISDDLLALGTMSGVLLETNPAWVKVCGRTPDELLGTQFVSLLHPDDADTATQMLAQLAEDAPHVGPPAPVTFQCRIQTPAFGERRFACNASRVDEHIYLSAKDITEEHQREAALKDSLDFTRLALSAVNGVGVWTYEVASDRFFCDEAISALYGIDPVEAANGILRERFLANIHPDDRAPLRATMSGGLVESGDLELEYRIVHPDGTIRHVLSRGHTYFDENGTPTRRTGVGVDTTNQRELEQQLRQSQKMDAVGHLTGGIAHDFNNILQGVIGPLELVRQLVARGRVGELDRFIDMSMSSAHRAAALTHRLLAFSRRQPLAATSVEVHQLVVSLEDLIRQSARENTTIVISGPVERCMVRCDRNQLENALINLTINACDAMPDGGTLAVTASIRSVDEHDPILPPGVAAGRFVCMTVSDTGIGIPKKVVDKVFEPFFTTKPMGRGTGLGLSMVYGFAGQSGGFIKIESEEGQGTAVHLYLPENSIADSMPFGPAPRRVALPGDTEGNGRTILIVDDDETVRHLLGEVLERAGYAIVSAADGPAGLAALRAEGHIDLLLTDVGLPGLNGRQLADAARVIRPFLPIILMTGYAEVASSGDILDDGMQMLTKPFSIDAVLSGLRTMLER